MEVCEATSITGQGFVDAAYFRDFYLREQLTDVKQHLPNRDYPYPITQHQTFYETVPTFSFPQITTVTTISPSVTSQNYTLNNFGNDSQRQCHHRLPSTLQTMSSTSENFYPKEMSTDQTYTQHRFHLSQQQQGLSQYFHHQSNNHYDKNVVEDQKMNQFKFTDETVVMTTTSVIASAADTITCTNTTASTTIPYTVRHNVVYSTPVTNEKQDHTLNNFNLCSTILSNTDTNISQWDVNDPKLPKIRQFDTFTMWPQGHCRYAYKKSQSEGARRHASGWAMRNTNNHNSQILKKSCLGVLLCTSKQCTLAMRPAICDKARRRQEGRQCCMPNCTGRIYIQSCHGHGGYPVTHFWREHGDTIYFQAKGTHDHIRPDLKPVRDTAARRRKHQQQNMEQIESGGEQRQRQQKVSRLHNMKNVKCVGLTQQQHEKKMTLISNPLNLPYTTEVILPNNTTINNITPTIDYGVDVNMATFQHHVNNDQRSNQFLQMHYNKRINTDHDLNKPIPTVNSSYCDNVITRKEPIFPGSNPFENNNELDSLDTVTMMTTETLPTTVTNTTNTNDTVRNLLMTSKNVNNSLEITKSPLSQNTIIKPSINNYNDNQSYDTTPTTSTLDSSTFPHNDTYITPPGEKFNSTYTQRDSIGTNNDHDNNNNHYYQSQMNLTPTKLSTSSACNTFYRYHFMNQLLMNSQLNPLNTTYNYQNHSSNSNTCGTNSESTSTYGLNASWSTPSPPTFGGVGSNSSLLNNNNTVYNGTTIDEIPLHNEVSLDSLKDLQSSLLNNIQEVNNAGINRYDPVNVFSHNNDNNINVESSSTYYDSMSQQLYHHNSNYYSRCMHKINLAGYQLTAPQQQYNLNNINDNSNDHLLSINQTGLTPSVFMSSSTPISTMPSKTMSRLYSSDDKHTLYTPTSRMTQMLGGTEPDTNHTHHNNNIGFSYIAPIPFYLNSSSESRSTRTDSSSDSSQSKQIML
ncbi:unnamed protein product [Schistosoma margrebowiei]|uniref:GCM domain-containing protein n=1 Tax=Schistosoma margrebowiei TaxID=48269 RepID=A0A183MLH1_9TREM|nr:unnamed protein product [Schistosoma margrebowiei]VDP22372.1 unnamed protein product [Schistosoma margrebowiei]